MSIFAMIGIAAAYILVLTICAYFVAEAYQTKMADIITGLGIPAIMLVGFLAFILIGDLTWKNLFLIGIVISIPTSITYVCVRLKGDSGMSSILFLILTSIIITLFCIFFVNTEYVVTEQNSFEVVAVKNTVNVSGSYASTSKEYIIFFKSQNQDGEIAKPITIPVERTTIYIVKETEPERLIIENVDAISSDRLRDYKVKWKDESFHQYLLYVRKDTLRNEV